MLTKSWMLVSVFKDLRQLSHDVIIPYCCFHVWGSVWPSTPPLNTGISLDSMLMGNVWSLHGRNWDIAEMPLLSSPKTCYSSKVSLDLISGLTPEKVAYGYLMFGSFFSPEGGYVQEPVFSFWVWGPKTEIIFSIYYKCFGMCVLGSDCSPGHGGLHCRASLKSFLLTLCTHTYVYGVLCCRMILSPHTSPVAMLLCQPTDPLLPLHFWEGWNLTFTFPGTSVIPFHVPLSR